MSVSLGDSHDLESPGKAGKGHGEKTVNDCHCSFKHRHDNGIISKYPFWRDQQVGDIHKNPWILPDSVAQRCLKSISNFYRFLLSYRSFIERSTPQISGQQNSHDFFTVIIYTDRHFNFLTLLQSKFQ